ncbi:pantetheinase isoform X2 [Anolis carolinensis]|uniref:pantetheinase isoform X2 n=1 Tax=Anolis carolinensis TaxID=28377 RepID=UPI0007DB6E5F|nr:PREDICTED: pantetheinase [Anolis carolinensis]|eukprot:XP_008112771.2 PREDICTED: pantetheinase [Anolis carolinensis]
MVAFQLAACTLLLTGNILQTSALDTYIAAVYEHAVILSGATTALVSREDALKLMNKNLDILEGAIKTAAEQGAHIIVTPEDGVFGWVFTRDSIYSYLENIPDPQVNWNPCIEPGRFGSAQVQERLSCMARNYSIYVVANMGDKKPCNSSDPQCPSDGRYQYNTNVVYDSEGKFVARYHKYNLFASEIYYNYAKDPQFVNFNTPFGKFGVFTCADMLNFREPAVSLVEKFKVDTVLFPTAWMNTLPLLSAVQYYSAWAMGMRINLLAANIHKPMFDITGSGIFAPDGPKAYHFDMETKHGKLLLADLDVHPRLSPTYPPPVNWSLYASSIKHFSPRSQVFNANIYFDNFTFTELSQEAGNYTVCHKGLCCHLSYKMTEKLEDEIYALGAFDGLHIIEGEYYLQICTLLKCNSTDVKSCGQRVDTAQTSFDSFSLSGTFNTSYVFPEVLLTETQLAPGEFQVLTDGRLISKRKLSKPVLCVALFGRWYQKDSPHPLYSSS